MKFKKRVLTGIFVAFMAGTAAFGQDTKTDSLILVTTEFGSIKIKLYNETPLHRDNMLKLVREKKYDSTLFHRVIKDFMIQGGDPDSKNAAPDAMLGNGDLGYTVPAEFNPALFHKKGVLAAARNGDEVNPSKASSSCQFYIVQGRVFSDADLNMMEANVNNTTKRRLFNEFLDRPENIVVKEQIIDYQESSNADSLNALVKKIEPIIMQEYDKTTPFKYSEAVRKAYTTIGGTPHLDMGYTVYGEVVEGMEVIDKIAAVQVGSADRPVKDVRMTVSIVR